jgi:hypothetical protein
VPRWVPVVAALVFAFSVMALLIGQVSPLLFFLIVTGWRLLEERRDLLAGGVMAAVATKPQLGIVLLPVILIWAARQRRWRVLQGFAGGLTGLCLAAFVVQPGWPLEMYRALERTPLVTKDAPWLGTTWWSVLRALGIPGWELWAAYLAVAGASILWVLATAWDRRRSADQVICVSILATFFVVSYARAYDLAVLVLPLSLLLRSRMGQGGTGLVFLVCIILPFGQFYFVPLSNPYRNEATFSWVPALLALIWLACQTELLAKCRVRQQLCQREAARGPAEGDPCPGRLTV